MQLHGHKVPLYIFKEAILPRAYSSDTLSSSKKKLSKWLGLFKLSRFKIQKRFSRGHPLDDIERLYQLKKKLGNKIAFSIFGYGEHRYILKK